MIYPMFALALLTLVVLLVNLVLRVQAVRAHRIDPRYFKTYQGEAPDYLVAASRNFSNLFETPVLFYVAGILTVVTNTAGDLVVALGWAYVVLRTIHSWIHITRNNVYMRMGAFAASILVLTTLWVLLGIRLL